MANLTTKHKRKTHLLALILGICMLIHAPAVLSIPGSVVYAAEYTVTPLNAVLYTGSGAELFAQPDPTTLVMALPGDIPVMVTGATNNGYFQILMNDTVYYVYAKALSVSTGTFAYKLTSIDARAALVGDAVTGEVYYAQNANTSMAPASTTKIMTALLVLDAVSQGTLSLDTQVVVSPTALAGIPSDASHVTPRLKAGEVMNVLQLLECVLIKSDCHACNVLAEATAGSVEQFVQLMNVRAAGLGCTQTNFVNTSGYPQEGHVTTAYSLFLIAREAMKYPAFQTIVAMQQIQIAPTNLTASVRTLESTNALITASEYYNPYAVGIKTGSAISSGQCLVAAARRGEQMVISVVLGASTNIMSDGTRQRQQFSESNKLLEIGLANAVK